MMKKKSRLAIRIMALFLTALLLLWQAPSVFAAQNSTDTQTAYTTTRDLLTGMADSVDWSPGATGIVLGLARAGELTDAQAQTYVSHIKDKLQDAGTGRLFDQQPIDQARVVLALTAAGYDAENIDGYNLVEPLADLSYVTRQGMSGTVWALLALDSGDYEITDGTANRLLTSRDNLINLILYLQRSNRGWRGSGSYSNVEMTCLAIQALAPYYGSKQNVTSAVDNAIAWLSSIQKEDGSVSSGNGNTAESTGQVIAALAAMGRNPETDADFVKEGNNLLDALLSLYVDGGGFHNTKDVDHAEEVASTQGNYALIAYYRFREGRSGFYQMADAAGISPIDPSASVYTEKTNGSETDDPDDPDDGGQGDNGQQGSGDQDDGSQPGADGSDDGTITDDGQGAEDGKKSDNVKKTDDTKKTVGTSGKNGSKSVSDSHAVGTNAGSGDQGSSNQTTGNQGQNNPAAGSSSGQNAGSPSNAAPSAGTSSNAGPSAGTSAGTPRYNGNVIPAAGRQNSTLQGAPAAVQGQMMQVLDRIVVRPYGSEIAKYRDDEIRMAADAYAAYLELDEAERAALQKDPTWEKFCSLTEEMGKQLHCDEESGISLQGNAEDALPWYVQISAPKLEPDEDLLRKMATATGYGGSLQNLYDISFTSILDNNAWEPEQTLAVTLPVLENAAPGQSLIVLHVKDDGELEFLDGEVSGETDPEITCQATAFSPYGVGCINGSLEELLSGRMQWHLQPLQGFAWFLIAGSVAAVIIAFMLYRTYFYERRNA